MTIQEQAQLPDADTAASAARLASRRRFFRTGTSGVILTLASSPGMAVVCRTPSGALSGALKSNIPDTPCIGGFSPGYWKKDDRAWPIARTTLFSSLFSCSGTPYAALTLGQMITQEDKVNAFDEHNLGCHLTATYLNILSGDVKFLTLNDDLVPMWDAIMTGGGIYHPTTDVNWDAGEVVDYLKSTYHDPKPKP